MKNSQSKKLKYKDLKDNQEFYIFYVGTNIKLHLRKIGVDGAISKARQILTVLPDAEVYID